MLKIDFREMVFLIEIIKIGQSKGFKFNTTNGKIEIVYPLFSNDSVKTVESFEELLIIKADILKWK
jgi:hypothetical protein